MNVFEASAAGTECVRRAGVRDEVREAVGSQIMSGLAGHHEAFHEKQSRDCELRRAMIGMTF